jgi:predicted transcriptional regulator
MKYGKNGENQMQTEIFKSYTKEQVEGEKNRLEAKYESIENLHQKFSVQKCRNPQFVDDYMVWKALSEEDISITEKIVLKNLDIYQMLSQKRMEILDYLSSHDTKSLKTLALELKRNYKNVYDDIKALAKFDLVELIDDGRNKRPITKLDSISVVPDKKAGHL